MELPDNLVAKSKWLKVGYGIIDVNILKTKKNFYYVF